MSGRVGERLETLYALGGGPGANRPGLSALEEEAHALLAGWLDEAGLEVSRDAVGNTFGRLRGARPDAPEVWVGSHLDSVPSGGRYDGALGVVAAVEAVERLQAPPERTVAVVALRDEEGWRFGQGFFGSRAVTGALEPADLAARDRDGQTVAEALTALGVDPSPAPAPSLPGMFFEAHIEQGPALEAAGAPLGVVTSIVGMAGLRVAFAGSSGHAGTVPLGQRRDALVATARYVIVLRDTAAGMANAVATVGECSVPGAASNVVPGRVELSVDARAADPDTLDELVHAAGALAHAAAGAEGCDAEVETVYVNAPVAMDATARDVLVRGCESAACRPLELVSGAGHDAGILGGAGVAAGMLFVRSGAGGVSHSPEEATDDEAIGLCVDALAAALAEASGTTLLPPEDGGSVATPSQRS